MSPFISLEKSTSPSLLLCLPAEIRVAILEQAILDTRNLSVNLTCRLIEGEARSMLYRRPVKFVSQAELRQWTAHSAPSYLASVSDLTLHIMDIDLEPIMLHRADQRPVTAWELYRQEAVHLEEAFSKLPNLKDVTIVPPRQMHSHFLRILYICTLQAIATQHPKLRALTVYDTAGVLKEAPALQTLPKIIWKGTTEPRQKMKKC